MSDSTLSLLRRNAPVRGLVAARLVSSAGTWLAYVALTVDVYSRTHSSAWVSAVLLAGFVPPIAVALLGGALLDRVPRRTLLAGAELAGAGVFALLPFAPSAASIVALALVAGFANAVFLPSSRAVLPELVDDADLPRANALAQTVATAGIAAGPVLAGLVVAAAGVDAAYAINAASFVMSAALLSRLPRGERRAPETSDSTTQGSAFEGLRVFFDTPALRMVLRVWVLAALGGATISVGEVFLARDTFGAGTFGFGLLASASGAGLVAGSALAPRLLDRGAARVCRLGIAAAAVGFGAAALAPGIWIAAACVLVGGCGNALMMSAITLLVQRETPTHRLGRAFAAFDGVGTTAMGVGMLAAGAAIGTLGARNAWLLAAGLMGVAAVTSLPWRGRVELSAPVAEPSRP